MEVFGALFNDLTGWLTVGIVMFMIAMMIYLFSMFVSKATKGEK